MNEQPDDIGKQPQFEFNSNPLGPWHNLSDDALKKAILTESREHFAAAQNAGPLDLPTFVDLFTAQWLEFKAKVEAEAMSHGFRLCKNLADVPPGARHKVAILALTINGSFVLLGNGCLTGKGSSGRYERIPYRITARMGNKNKTDGVACVTEPAVGSELHCRNLINTSPLYLLYYTTEPLPGNDMLRMGDSLSMSQTQFATKMRETVGGGETVPTQAPQRRHNVPELPEEVPAEV